MEILVIILKIHIKLKGACVKSRIIIWIIQRESHNRTEGFVWIFLSGEKLNHNIENTLC